MCVNWALSLKIENCILAIELPLQKCSQKNGFEFTQLWFILQWHNCMHSKMHASIQVGIAPCIMHICICWKWFSKFRSKSSYIVWNWCRLLTQLNYRMSNNHPTNSGQCKLKIRSAHNNFDCGHYFCNVSSFNASIGCHIPVLLY